MINKRLIFKRFADNLAINFFIKGFGTFGIILMYNIALNVQLYKMLHVRIKKSIDFANLFCEI